MGNQTDKSMESDMDFGFILGDLNNFQHDFEVYLRNPVPKFYMESRTAVLAIIQAST